MYCKECGNRIDDNSKFCSVCGAKQMNIGKNELSNEEPIRHNQKLNQNNEALIPATALQVFFPLFGFGLSVCIITSFLLYLFLRHEVNDAEEAAWGFFWIMSILVTLINIFSNVPRFKGAQHTLEISNFDLFIEDLSKYITNPTTKSIVEPPHRIDNVIYLKFNNIFFKSANFSLTRIIWNNGKVVIVGPAVVVGKLRKHFRNRTY